MKQDAFLKMFLVGFATMLAGCGQATNMAGAFQDATAECASSALPTQFIVRHVDNSVEVVRAASEDEFINVYLKQNATTVRYAEHDYRVFASAAAPTDPPPPPVSSADNWGQVNISASAAWSQNIRGSGIVVAVVDTGMDFTHPQLQNQVYTNPGETGLDSQGHQKATNGIDDDGNGYVDDYLGYDFSQTPAVPLKGDNAFHGTHVAGIIAAAHNDSSPGVEPYVEGVAPQAKLMPLAFMDNTGSGDMSNAVLAIQYAVKQGARVINASWGGPSCSVTLQDEVASLSQQNVAFVNAAGNSSEDIDQTPSYPASLDLPSQFTVGAIGNHDYMAQYSNYGPLNVHLFAPGTNVISTIPGGAMGLLSGTSMASPFVAGALALMLSAVPKSTLAQLRGALYASAIQDSTYLNASKGRLNLTTVLSQLHQITGQ